jgi:hypothetical protein
MATPKERDLFSRALNADWDSRVEFFKRFVWENSRVRRLGVGCSNMDDFLHDVFTNILRTAHSFDLDENLGEWVEYVATWTALERRRMRDSNGPDAARVRLCASMERDEPGNRGRLSAYHPPKNGPADTLTAWLSSTLGEPQFTVLSASSKTNATLEDAASAAGRQLNTAGPMVVKAVDRMSRFFGAPPPLNQDLEPVFAWMVRMDASVSKGDPGKLKGRIQSMNLDPTFYAVTPEMRRLGLSVPSEVRTMVLWDAARSSEAPNEPLREHLAQCRYCSDLLRALLRLHQALKSPPDVDFLICPGACTLLDRRADTEDTFDRHLEQCTACQHERTRAKEEVETGARAERKPGKIPTTRIAWITAGLLIVIAAVVFLRSSRGEVDAGAAAKSEQPAIVKPPAPHVTVNPRYAGLSQMVNVSDPKLMESVLPRNRKAVYSLISQMSAGEFTEARLILTALADDDPGAQLLESFILYQLNATDEAYGAMLRAESMPPPNSFRCWTTMQSAINVGDLPVVRREAQHLSADPAYAARAKDLLSRVEARK